MACVEVILRLFTNFYLQRKFLIFLRNDHDCKVVDPYKARKRYTVTEKFACHCFCKIQKPNKNFLKLKCDWWCPYFDTTDSYLRVGMFGGSMSLNCFGGFLDQVTTEKKVHSSGHWLQCWIVLAGSSLYFLAGSLIKVQITTGKKGTVVWDSQTAVPFFPVVILSTKVGTRQKT